MCSVGVESASLSLILLLSRANGCVHCHLTAWREAGYFRFPGDARVASHRFLTSRILTSRSHRYKILFKTFCGLYFMVRLNIHIWHLDYCRCTFAFSTSISLNNGARCLILTESTSQTYHFLFPSHPKKNDLFFGALPHKKESARAALPNS